MTTFIRNSPHNNVKQVVFRGRYLTEYARTNLQKYGTHQIAIIEEDDASDALLDTPIQLSKSTATVA
jgi:hypothetical protein